MEETGDAWSNRSYWDGDSDEYQRLHEPQLNRPDPAWGVWGLPESDLRLLGDVSGRDVLELGCGGAQWSIRLSALGARVVGLDNSGRQLAHARRLADASHARVRLVHASAERVPFRDGSFDLIFCDHGGMSFADPERTVAEAARLLRSGGQLVFNMASPFVFITWDPAAETPGERLTTDYFALGRFQWADGLVEYQLAYGAWIRLFRRNGFVVEDLVELRPPEGATTTYEWFAPLEWARRWPAENVWRVRKRG